MAALATIVTLTLASCASGSSETVSSKVAGDVTTPAMPDVGDPIAAELDSLAAISVGEYIHFRVGQCFGYCDMKVSIYRESPSQLYTYDAEGYDFSNEERRAVLFRERRPIRLQEAEAIIRSAREAGLESLVPDTSMVATDHPYIWVRAGGWRTERDRGPLSIDKAYTGGREYDRRSAEGAKRSDMFNAVRHALGARLFRADR